MRTTGITITAIIVVAVGAFVLVKATDKPASSPTASNPAASSQALGTNSNTNQSSGNTITYGDSGYSPATLTVKVGTKITIKNVSSHDMQFDSDPHPAHTDDLELNVGIVSPGQSATFTVTTKGTHGYHNHLNPVDIGTIIVE